MFTERVGETSGKNIDRGGADLFFLCSGHLVHHAEEMNNDNINDDNTSNDEIITLINTNNKSNSETY